LPGAYAAPERYLRAIDPDRAADDVL